ncbi:MAG: GDSL-type esterase/lipase family protein [Kangiellaceae bacterium]|jgi:lysophospholipase L1-like esterase|nr:GDSL-type esterase/lipase family protein [Kangiellaceae bacterium]
MNKYIKYSVTIILAVLIIGIGSAALYYFSVIEKTISDDPLVWEDDITAFEQNDKTNEIAENSILFVGSSSIRFWGTLEQDMHPIPVLNRGFGGAKIPDIVHYLPRIVLPYKPKIIVFYAGDNDMSMGRLHTAKEVLRNYQAFVSLTQRELPNTKIFFISIKPSIARWQYWSAMNKANDMIKSYSESDHRLEFIDITGQMLGDDGKPRGDILIIDGVHMNSKGYDIWTSTIKPIIAKEYEKVVSAK